MADWWKKLLGKSTDKSSQDAPASSAPASGGPPAEPKKATWLAADHPGNPFGVDLLDLTVTQTVVATSTDPLVAARSVGWHESVGSELDISALLDRPPIACDIRLPIERGLPDGLIFTPASMDEKWVIAWRDGRIIAARSWTGQVDAIADAKLDGSALVIESIRTSESSPLGTFGKVPETFEWLLRSHALREKLPFPCDDDGAKMLESVPLSAFSAFGKLIFCAAKQWKPPPPSKPLRSNGRIHAAARKSNFDELARLVGAGEDIDAPTTSGGYTVLHLAITRSDIPLLERVIALGADVNRRTDTGMFTLGIAIVHKAPPALLDVLVRAGVDLNASNNDGFNALHAACEIGSASAVRWLVEHGHGLEPRTKRGHTPLQIACALGHLDAAKAMVELGADLDAPSPDGMALEIAKHERRPEIVAWLESRR